MTTSLHALTAGPMEGEGEKIAIISHSHPSISKGGAEIAAYTLYRGLLAIGIDAIFIGACDAGNRHKLLLASEREYAVFYRPEDYEHFYHLAPYSVTEQVMKILEDEEVTVVNFHHFINIGLNTLRVVKQKQRWNCFFTIHEFLAMCQNHGQMVTRPGQVLCDRAVHENCLSCFPERSYTQFEARKDLMLDTFGNFDGFISPSNFLARRFVEWGLAPERVTVIENGLQSVHPQPRPPKTSDTWTFGFFGQINPFKGVDVILDAVERLAGNAALARRVRFKIHGNLIGQSPEFVARFERLLAKYDYLSYAGAYNNASVGQLMSRCDYVLVPSNWWENSPVVIQEAYSVGSPLICSGIGGMAEKVPDGVSGLNFQVGDSLDFLRAIEKAANKNVWHTLNAGIPKVLDASEMASRYIEFFEMRLNGDAGSAPAPSPPQPGPMKWSILA